MEGFSDNHIASHLKYYWTRRSFKILACISCHSLGILQSELVMCHIYRPLSLYILHESWAGDHHYHQKWHLCWAGLNLHIQNNTWVTWWLLFYSEHVWKQSVLPNHLFHQQLLCCDWLQMQLQFYIPIQRFIQGL